MNHIYPAFMTSPIGLQGDNIHNNQLVGIVRHSDSKSNSYIYAKIQSCVHDLKISFKDRRQLIKFGRSFNPLRIMSLINIISINVTALQKFNFVKLLFILLDDVRVYSRQVASMLLQSIFQQMHLLFSYTNPNFERLKLKVFVY